MTLHIFFLRHGQTYLNKYEKMQGWADSPLTKEGIEEVRKCGDRLKHLKFHKIYSSDMGRTIQTAKIFTQANEHDCPKLIKIPQLRETFFGSFEGEKSDIAWKTITESLGYHDFWEMMQNTSIDIVTNAMHKADPDKDAESFEDFCERIERALQIIIEDNSDKDNANVLVVTHGNTIRCMLQFLNPSGPIILGLKNAGITQVDWIDGRYMIQKVNE